jgi:thiol-disulfide isomerase/thioredoxin
LKRERLETFVAIGILISLAIAIFCLVATAHHRPPTTAHLTVQVEPQHVAPAKETAAPPPAPVHEENSPPSDAAAAPVPGSADLPGTIVETPSPQLPSPQLPASAPHLAVLGAEWCGPCKRLEREVLPDLSDLNLLLIDIDNQAEVAAKLYSPQTHAVPQFVLLDAAEKPTDWLVGYQSAQRVRKFLQQPETGTKSKEKSAAPPACAAPARTGTHQDAPPRLFRRWFAPRN